MSQAERELTAAGILGAGLRRSYLDCRALHARHGRTYFLATRLLPPHKRPHVHALYGFARYADEIVDTSPGNDAHERIASVRLADADIPVMPALRHTMDRFALPAKHIRDFLDSMTADLTVTEYPTYDDLAAYMWGSAAVIGLLTLPVLGTSGAPADAEPYAANLGIAFQLTNFLRDVGEDLDRGRIYLPTADLDRFGVDRDRLRAGIVDDAFCAAMRFEVARARGIYRAAEPGIALLAPESRGCVWAAYQLYSDILDEIERLDYQVLTRRATVSRRRRASVGAVAAARTVAARIHPFW